MRIRKTIEVLEEGRIELSVPELRKGTTAEVTVDIPDEDPLFGFARGSLIFMADDFNDPLDEFGEPTK